MSENDLHSKYTILTDRAEHDDLLSLLLANRGVDAAECEAFCNPDWDQHYDPFLMHNMTAVVHRVWQAIEKNERLVVFSDYDADGVPGAVVLSDFFTKIGFTNFTVHIPNRNTDGFGLNHTAVQQFIADDTDLLISIDCGIADLAEIAALQAGGVEVIITDHHLPTSEGLPDCLVLDPKQPDCQYPFPDLCGAGVIFKLVQGMIQDAKKQAGAATDQDDKGQCGITAKHVADMFDGQEKWLLDMVGIATICDMVPLVGENRIFAHYGLRVLRKSPRPGLQKMLALARANQASLTAQDVAFTLGPRINAASRLGEPMVAFHALRATNGDASLIANATAAAEELERVNRQRKTRVAQAAKAAYAQLDAQDSDRQVVVVGDTSWPLGIVGLIAGTLANHYAKPAFVWTRVGDDYRGSVRAGNGESIHDLMSSCDSAFTSFGGHDGAGGFVCSQDEIHALPDALESAFAQLPEREREKESIDTTLTPDEVTHDVFNAIQSLEPHGFGNRAPQFLLENITIQSVRTFGKDGTHLNLSFTNSSGRRINATQFHSPHLGAKHPSEGDRVHLVGSLELNTYRGASELRIRIMDIFPV